MLKSKPDSLENYNEKKYEKICLHADEVKRETS